MLDEIMAEHEVDGWEPPVMKTECELVLNLSRVSGEVAELQLGDDQREPAVVEDTGFTEEHLLDF